jgi:hypothetical protein
VEINGGPPPVTAGTVVIVTPRPPIMQGAVAMTAAPGQAAELAPAPALQNEPWSNVSHINGQLVKVGERGDYLYDNGKRTNIASNPIGWMFGFYGISVSHAVHPNVAIRGDVNYFDLNGETGHELGLSVPIYFRRVFQGPFLEPGVVTRNFNDNCSGCGNHESAGPEVLFGWQWSFDSGLNVAMALGAMRNVNNNSNSSSSGAELAGYFRIGYAM